MNELKIIDTIDNNSILNVNGIPNKKRMSDHLPIKFKLKMEVIKNYG